MLALILLAFADALPVIPEADKLAVARAQLEVMMKKDQAQAAALNADRLQQEFLKVLDAYKGLLKKQGIDPEKCMVDEKQVVVSCKEETPKQ